MPNRLSEAIASCCQRALETRPDAIIRLDADVDWPLVEAFSELKQRNQLKLLIRKPFEVDEFGEFVASADPVQANRWRNDSKRTEWVIVLGRFDGRMDAGLRNIRPVTKSEVFENWAEAELQGMRILGGDLSGANVVSLLRAIFEEAPTGTVESSQIRDYLSEVVHIGTLDAVQKEVWRLGLIPDSRLIDGGRQPHQRLRLNRDLVERLRNLDENAEAALREASTKDDKNIRRSAKGALEFSTTGEFSKLEKVEFDDLLSGLRKEAKPRGTSRWDLFKLLDHFGEHQVSVLNTLEELASAWHADQSDCVEAAFDGVEERVNVHGLDKTFEDNSEDPALRRPWTSGSFVLACESSDHDPLNASPLAGTPLTATLLEQFPSGLAYIEARKVLAKFEPWLASQALELLILVEEARTAVGAFVEAWCELARDVIENYSDDDNLIRCVQWLETIQARSKNSLDVDDREWVRLGPFHPFHLDPLHKIAAAATVWATPGAEDPPARIGEAIRWMRDRAYPAYPNLYSGKTALRRASTTPLTYRKDAPAFLPDTSDASGLKRVLEAISSYSPWFEDSSVTVLAIDPPRGGAIPGALNHWQSVGRVRRLATAIDADTLDTLDLEVEHLASNPDGQLTAGENIPAAEVVLRFASAMSSTGVATASLHATRGVHLALALREKSGFGFGPSTPQLEVQVAPQGQNDLVSLAQGLFGKIGGNSPLATLRPLLQTDDAAVLSKMADKADWVVFAAAGPLGLVAPKTINSTLHYVGRGSMGPYGLYVYAADGMFPVRRHLENVFKDKPVASLSAELLVDRLASWALDVGNAVLFASRGSATPKVAALTALHIAREDAGGSDYVLNLDELGWTSAWLDRGLRADFLVIRLQSNGSIVLRVVESKSQEGAEKVVVSNAQTHYEKGIRQVVALRSQLKKLLETPQSLAEDLRFANLVEHLMAAVLPRLESMDRDQRKAVLDLVNGFARRDPAIQVSTEGWVILTQPDVNAPRKIVMSDDTSLVWCGAPDVHAAFGGLPLHPVDPPEDDDGGNSGVETVDPSPEPPDIDTEQQEEAEQSVRDFILAARNHGFPLSSPDPVYILTGPTLVAAGLKLRPGEKLAPLQARLADVARDIGLGDRADKIVLENDSRPFTARLLLPNPHRYYPVLPATNLSPVVDAGYLPVWLGQEIDGRDHQSTLQSWPHMLVAGTTGSGKTTFMRSLLRQFGKHGCDRMQIVVVDGKGDTDYLGLLDKEMFPRAFPDVELGADRAVDALRWAVAEMDRRQDVIQQIARLPEHQGKGIKLPDLYAAALANGNTPPLLPLLVVIDEFADIMLVNRKSADEFESLVQRVTQIGRSRLVHLILATQRPDKETVKGAIKANLNARVILRLPTVADSLTVLGQGGAEKLLPHGDLLFQSGSGLPLRLQGYSV